MPEWVYPATVAVISASRARCARGRSRRWSILATYCLILAVMRELRRRKLQRMDESTALPWQLTFVEFPTLWEVGTSFGLFYTFAIPTISAILDRTGEFKRAAEKRQVC